MPDDRRDDDGDPDDENSRCHYCGGEGWGFRGSTWDNDDPINQPDGEIERCPCCGGSGKAEDCVFW